MPRKKSKLTRKKGSTKVSSLVDMAMKESNELDKEILKTIQRYSQKKALKDFLKKLML